MLKQQLSNHEIYKHHEEASTTHRYRKKIIELSHYTTWPLKKMDGVLLDDSELNTLLWKIEAEKNKKKISIYKTVNEFLESIINLERRCPLYIDRHLKKEGVIGDDLAKLIYEILGFKNIIITTGDYNEDQSSHLPYISKIIGKGFVTGLRV